MGKIFRRLLIGFAALVVVIAVLWQPITSFLIDEYGELTVYGARDLLLLRLGLKKEPAPLRIVAAPDPTRAPIELDTDIIPFKEIGESLGPRALNRDIASLKGVTVLDANGDGRLDLYIGKNQRTKGKKTGPDAVLTNEYLPAEPNVLFLNQGNDPDGHPRFVAVQELIAAGNDRYTREELLIEGKYEPRTRIDEDENRIGRVTTGAVAADFNGDGRPDLYVLNDHYGLPYQINEVGMRVYPPRKNLGRDRHAEPLVVTLPPFLHTPVIEDGLNVVLHYGEKEEAEGSNRLYLNLGDRDADGIPEWEDATDRAGVGGHWASVSAAVADYDRDGDLDLYVGNFLDPDFWGFGDDRFAGNRNQLYKNLLAETGDLRFVDMASELRVAGLHNQEGISSTIYSPKENQEIEISEQVVQGRVVGEKADHTWAVLFHDWNRDDWPDLIVANDIGNRLRVYANRNGETFDYLDEFDAQNWEGCWMGMASGDLNSDGREEVLITSCGSQTVSVRNTGLLIENYAESSMAALSQINYTQGRNTFHHELLQYEPEKGFERLATRVGIHHSPYIAPDQTRAENFHPEHVDLFEKYNFGGSITGLEFAWNVALFDVDNDSDLDAYFIGSFARGNDNFWGDFSGSPGRFLVNESADRNFRFRDRTLEYRLFDIRFMEYDHNPPRRPAPGTGWHKRDYIYLEDTDSYHGMGVEASNSQIHDLIRMHEAGYAVVAADLNQDGYRDIVVTHGGGYDDNSPAARNLKVNFAGKVLALPPPSKLLNAPTPFTPGPTFVYLNGGPPKNTAGHWIRIRLRDLSGFNVYGIGAKVTVNDRIVRRARTTNGTMSSSVHEDLHVGLSDQALTSLRIIWPSGDQEPQTLAFDPPVANRQICIDRSEGVIACDSSWASLSLAPEPGSDMSVR